MSFLVLNRVKKGTGGAAFAPSDIAGLVGWWDFSDISTLYQDSSKTTPVASDGDPIGCIEDKSSSGNDVSNVTVSAKPTYKTGIQNGLSAGLGDGGDRLFNNTTFSLTTPATILIALKLTGTVGADFTPVGTTNGAFWRTYFDTFAGTEHISVGISSQVRTSYTWPTDFGTLNTVYKNNDGDVYWDSGAIVTGAAIGTGTIGAIEVFNLQNSNFFVGYIGEVLIYSQALSVGDLTSARTYLIDKWGIT